MLKKHRFPLHFTQEEEDMKTVGDKLEK